MEAILKFDLNDEDDRMAHLRAVKSLDMALALWQLIYNTKKGLGNEIEFKKIEDPYEVLDKVYEKIYEIMDEYGIKIDELIN